ncbi:MAG TPA: molybdopterin molybdotransferase MoeA [Streptosporangiaceae bacterium]
MRLRQPKVETAVPWGTARDRAAAAPALAPVRLPLAAARGTVLAAPLYARSDLPACDTAAMDGYAVAGPGPWVVIGRVLPGRCGPRALSRGEAVEIGTGAAVPSGAGAVLPYERAARAGDEVAGLAEPGRHVRRRGEECAAGTAVLPEGAVLTPAALGLAASLGHDAVTVRPRPRVAALITGDEIVQSGPSGPGRTRDAVGPLLPGLVDWAGGTLAPPIQVPDRRDELTAALAGAPDASGVDVVTVCGASSRGPADHLRGVLREAGAELLVEGVACRPGHPQLLARMPGGPLVVGLPGNPYAALVAALTLLVPALAGLTGRVRRSERAHLDGEVAAHAGDTRLIPVRRTANGVAPVDHVRPALLWGAAVADAIAVIPATGAANGVELLPLPG